MKILSFIRLCALFVLSNYQMFACCGRTGPAVVGLPHPAVSAHRPAGAARSGTKKRHGPSRQHGQRFHQSRRPNRQRHDAPSRQPSHHRSANRRPGGSRHHPHCGPQKSASQKSSGPSHRQDGGCTSPSTGCIRGQNRYKTRCKIHRHQGPQHQKTRLIQPTGLGMPKASSPRARQWSARVPCG